MMNPAAAGDGGGDAGAWTATVTHQESYGDEEEITTHQTGTKPCLVWVFRVINMILCVMMAATGAIGIKAGALGIITAIAVAVDGGLLILLFLKYPHMYPKD